MDLLDEDEILENRTEFRPEREHKAVYFCTRGEEIVYVGRTSRWVGRIGEHVGEFDFDGFYVHELGENENYADVEKKYLIKFNPEENDEKDEVSLPSITQELSTQELNILERNEPLNGEIRVAKTGRAGFVKSLSEELNLSDEMSADFFYDRKFGVYMKLCEDKSGSRSIFKSGATNFAMHFKRVLDIANNMGEPEYPLHLKVKPLKNHIYRLCEIES